MSILHCITCIDDAGGAEKLMEELLPSLKKEGCDVSCLVFNGFDSQNRRHLEANGVKVYELARNSHYYNPWHIIQMIGYCHKYDVVHTHNTSPIVFTAIANLFVHTNIIATMHSTDGRTRHSWYLRMVERWCLNQYKHIICCSIKSEQELRKYLGDDSKRITTVNNGINLQKFINAKPSEDILKIRLNDKKIITMVAWFRPPKNQINVMDAVEFLGPEYELIFVGDGENKQACMDYAKQKGLEDRVHFLGLRTDVPEILKASDYVVLSSHYEGLSLSSVEGMAAGKPFIASDVKGLREVVGGAGLLFEDGNAEDLAKQILRLSQDKDYYDEVSRKCLDRAMMYDIHTMAKKYKEVYDNLN